MPMIDNQCATGKKHIGMYQTDDTAGWCANRCAGRRRNIDPEMMPARLAIENASSSIYTGDLAPYREDETLQEVGAHVIPRSSDLDLGRFGSNSGESPSGRRYLGFR